MKKESKCEAKTVIAVKPGFDGVKRREKGEIFQYEGSIEKISWMKECKEEPKKADDKKSASSSSSK
jgi:hypothetical protein